VAGNLKLDADRRPRPCRADTNQRTVSKNDYLAGGHHRWTHFVCGLIFGGPIGMWIAWGWFDSRWAFIVCAVLIALLIALACARWGDSAWRWIMERAWWWS
jgi:hypothetical protein